MFSIGVSELRDLVKTLGIEWSKVPKREFETARAFLTQERWRASFLAKQCLQRYVPDWQKTQPEYHLGTLTKPKETAAVRPILHQF